MKKMLIILAVFIIIGVCFKSKAENNIVIPNNSLRLRVISNSNNIEDYQVKMQVRNAVELYLTNLLNAASSLDETKKIVADNLDSIENEVAKVLDPQNINYNINYGENYFPTKMYKGVIYEEGDYDSLVISIGEAKGDNWWCVLFPPLCLLEDNGDMGDVEYQLYVTRIIDAFK